MANNADMDDDDIYPENDDYVPQGSRMQDDEEEEGEEVESDSDVCSVYSPAKLTLTCDRTISILSQMSKTNRNKTTHRVCIT